MPQKNKKPRGYWDNFENVRAELLAFMQEHDLTAIPARAVFVKHKRQDLSNAIGNQGGSYAVAQKMGLQLAHGHKPLGYWNDFENLRRELLVAMEENGWQVIPIQPKLIAVGRHDLALAMTKHGGIYKVAERLSIGLETDEKPNGYWTLETTLCELREFIAEHKLNSFPTDSQLEEYNRQDLKNAIRHNGGTFKVAPLLGLLSKNRPADYWTVERLTTEIAAYMEEKGLDTLPLLTILLEDGRLDLLNAIAKFGGIHKVAKMMGKRTSGRARPIGYWTEETLRLEFEKFFVENGFRKIPTYDELVAMGRQDLTGAMVKFGGVYKVAEILGVEISATGKPNGYWTLENTRKELLDFMSSTNMTAMPSGRQLQDAGRTDLLGAIQKFGGIYECARLFSLEIQSRSVEITVQTGENSFRTKNITIRKKQPSYWTLENLKKEIYTLIEDNGLDYFPTTTFLYDQHRSDLVAAIGKHGGVFVVAKAFGIPLNTRKPMGYWTIETIQEELLALMEQNGFTRLPTKTFFEDSGRYDLLSAIGLRGGLTQIAELLGLEMENPYRPAGYWTLDNLEIELVHFLEENNLDTMPSMEFIKSAGRGDLEGAIAKFGGVQKVCQALGIEINFDPEKAFNHFTCNAEDGHFCYSKNEKIIDDWLYSHGVQHEKEVHYPYHEKYNQSNYVCDWLCGDIYLEYAGMMNIARYARSIQNKKALAGDLGLKLEILLPENINDISNKLIDIFHLEDNYPRQLLLFG